MPLVAEVNSETPTVIDPITGEEMPWGTTSIAGLCSGVSGCPVEYSNVAKLNFWEYPVVDINYIDVTTDCEPATTKECAPCAQ